MNQGAPGALVAFRVDASPGIGAGHLVRCLALATALRARGARCLFVCAQLPPVIAGWIAAQACELERLAIAANAASDADAEATASVLAARGCDWLVVDSYRLGAEWESALRAPARRLLAIDDLATRAHDVDMLVDHNAGREAADYLGRVPAAARLLVGPSHALLRAQFAARRAQSLARRTSPALRHVVVAMGGGDSVDATGVVLQALAASQDAGALAATVLLGSQARGIERIRAWGEDSTMPTRVLVDCEEVAAELSACDFAIGAGGGGALERCCLGVPSATVVLADNQRAGSLALAAAGASLPMNSLADIPVQLPRLLARVRDPEALRALSAAAAALVDGEGAARVAAAMLS